MSGGFLLPVVVVVFQGQYGAMSGKGGMHLGFFVFLALLCSCPRCPPSSFFCGVVGATWLLRCSFGRWWEAGGGGNGCAVVSWRQCFVVVGAAVLSSSIGLGGEWWSSYLDWRLASRWAGGDGVLTWGPVSEWRVGREWWWWGKKRKRSEQDVSVTN